MEDQGQNDPLFPIAVLIDELKVNSLPTAYLPTTYLVWVSKE